MESVINLYVSHITYYISIYCLIDLAIIFNFVFIKHLCKSKKYKFGAFVILQSIILDIALVLFSICNVVILEQWIKNGYSNSYMMFTGVAIIITLASVVFLVVDYSKNKK